MGLMRERGGHGCESVQELEIALGDGGVSVCGRHHRWMGCGGDCVHSCAAPTCSLKVVDIQVRMARREGLVGGGGEGMAIGYWAGLSTAKYRIGSKPNFSTAVHRAGRNLLPTQTHSHTLSTHSVRPPQTDALTRRSHMTALNCDSPGRLLTHLAPSRLGLDFGRVADGGARDQAYSTSFVVTDATATRRRCWEPIVIHVATTAGSAPLRDGGATSYGMCEYGGRGRAPLGVLIWYGC